MNNRQGTVVAVCGSPGKGEGKKERGRGGLVQGFGLAGDGRGGDWHRRVSLLAVAEPGAVVCYTVLPDDCGRPAKEV